VRHLDRRNHCWDSWFDSQSIALMLIVAVLGVVLAAAALWIGLR
jgi:hypothetical protein